MLQGLLDHQEAFLHIATVTPCIALPPADDASVLLWQMLNCNYLRSTCRTGIGAGEPLEAYLSHITDTLCSILAARSFARQG